MAGIPAADAGELGLTLSIALVHIATARAGTATVAWVYPDTRHASPLCLVDNTVRQMPKTPIVLPVALPNSNRRPVAYPGQVFQDQRGFRVFGFRNNSFRNTVIHPPLKPPLHPCQGLQSPLGLLAPPGLKGLAMRHRTLTDPFNLRPTVGLAFRVGGKVDDTQVHAKKLRGRNRCAFRDLNRGIEVERPIPVDEIDLSPEPLHKTRLVLTIHHGHHFTALQREERDVRWSFPAKQAFIVGHRALGPKHRADFLVPFERLDGLANGTYRHLRRQAKAVTQLPVTPIVDRLLRKDVILKPHLCRIGRSGIEGVHRLQQRRVLCGRWNQFELQCQLHRIDYILWSQQKQDKPVALAGQPLFLPALNGGVSQR